VIPYGMWVPIAVWQPCKLLYTCYLLTLTLVTRLSSVCSVSWVGTGTINYAASLCSRVGRLRKSSSRWFALVGVTAVHLLQCSDVVGWLTERTPGCKTCYNYLQSFSFGLPTRTWSNCGKEGSLVSTNNWSTKTAILLCCQRNSSA